MTTSPRLELVGSQVPRVLLRPEYANELAGTEAIQLGESAGIYLDPWQALEVNVTLAEGEDGRYAAAEVGSLVARQNGKGVPKEVIVLHGLFVVRDPLTLWTAHQFKTSSEAFLRIRGWIDGSDELRRRVKRINAAHGEEGIELYAANGEAVGPRLRFLARSKSSGRGFSPQRIIFDEAQELAKVAAEAMLPSMRAQWNRQAIYTGTVPGEEINNPEHWERLRDRGRAGAQALAAATNRKTRAAARAAAGRLAWLEYSPEGSDVPETARDIDLADPANWVASNPGLGNRPGLGIETLADDYDSLSADSFGRECLSIWPSQPQLNMDKAFGPGVWAGAKTDDPPGVPVAIGVSVEFDRSSASIAAADREDVTHLAATDQRDGTAWVPAEVVRIQSKHDLAIVIKAKSAAATLIQDIEDLGGIVTLVTVDEYQDACGELFDGMTQGDYCHGGYPELDAAVGLTDKRKIGGRWVWDGAGVAMLEAATLAAKHARREADPSVYSL